MASFHLNPNLIIHESAYWMINQRVNSHLPGYLIIGSKIDTAELDAIPEVGLSELGSFLAKAQRILKDLYSPSHIYVGRYGHMEGHSIHFHIIPVYDWVTEAFVKDERYRVLHQFYTPGVYEKGSDMPFDGAEMTLFIWREFCESLTPPKVIGSTVAEAVEAIKTQWVKK